MTRERKNLDSISYYAEVDVTMATNGYVDEMTEEEVRLIIHSYMSVWYDEYPDLNEFEE